MSVKLAILDLRKHKRILTKHIILMKTVEHLCSQESHLFD